MSLAHPRAEAAPPWPNPHSAWLMLVWQPDTSSSSSQSSSSSHVPAASQAGARGTRGSASARSSRAKPLSALEMPGRKHRGSLTELDTPPQTLAAQSKASQTRQKRRQRGGSCGRITRRYAHPAAIQSCNAPCTGRAHRCRGSGHCSSGYGCECAGQDCFVRTPHGNDRCKDLCSRLAPRGG